MIRNTLLLIALLLSLSCQRRASQEATTAMPGEALPKRIQSPPPASNTSEFSLQCLTLIESVADLGRAEGATLGSVANFLRSLKVSNADPNASAVRAAVLDLRNTSGKVLVACEHVEKTIQDLPSSKSTELIRKHLKMHSGFYSGINSFSDKATNNSARVLALAELVSSQQFIKMFNKSNAELRLLLGAAENCSDKSR